MHVGHIYPGMLLIRPVGFGNIGVKIEGFHTKILLYGSWGKKTEYLRTLDPHSSGQQSARAEQLLLSVTARTLQFATLLIIPYCFTPGQFHSFALLFWPL